METICACYLYCMGRLYTDPTYKEWKPSLRFRIGSNAGNTDPTYKEWKLSLVSRNLGSCDLHGSYLQGMETNILPSPVRSQFRTRILPTRNGNHGLNNACYGKNYTDPTYKEWKPSC